jgi:hypothetical protein
MMTAGEYPRYERSIEAAFVIAVRINHEHAVAVLDILADHRLQRVGLPASGRAYYVAVFLPGAAA